MKDQAVLHQVFAYQGKFLETCLLNKAINLSLIILLLNV